MGALECTDATQARAYFGEKPRFTTTPAALAKAMGEGTVRVVDVRAVADFARGHVPGSVSLAEEAWATSSERGLARDRANVVLGYAAECTVAARAMTLFTEQDYPVVELEGGFARWKAEGLPVEKTR